MEREPKTVGGRLRKLRLARKLTQQQLAKILGIKQGSLTQLETGKSKGPAASTLTRAARFFEVDPEWLMTGKGSEEPVASLEPDESELILIYRSLSPAGRAYLAARAKALHQDERSTAAPSRRRDDPKPPPAHDGH